MRICVIIGTRAELIKTVPFLSELEKSDIDYTFLSTGQHDLESLCEDFGISKPDKVLSKAPEKSSRFNTSTNKALLWNVGLIWKLIKELRKMRFDYVIYHGDTMSSALAAFSTSRFFFPFKRFKSVHIESGLRSGSLLEPFPEEISRRVADFFSDILFAVSEKSESNLSLYKWMGKRIYNIGNTIIDSANLAMNLAKNIQESDFGVVTVHRHENLKSKERMESIVDILEGSPKKLLFFLHDNTKKSLKEYNLFERLKDGPNIDIRDLLSYPDFLSYLSNSEIVYTDGGSIQEESFIFKVPCILLRNHTERKEGLESDLNFLSRFDVEETIKRAREMVDEDFRKVKNPYGEKGVSKRILRILEKYQRERQGKS